MIANTPLFIRFCNGESVSSVISSIIRTADKRSSAIAILALENPSDLEDFRKELQEAVKDLVNQGLGEELKAFANHYMEGSVEQDMKTGSTPQGENFSVVLSIKDADSTWIQGFICFNLCLYVKAFGLENLKICRTCGKYFDHKGKYAVYCSDVCKKQKPAVKKDSPSVDFSDIKGPFDHLKE